MVILAEMIKDDPTPPQLTGLMLHDLGGEISSLISAGHRPIYSREGVRGVAHRLGIDITFEALHAREFTPPDNRTLIDEQADHFLKHLDDIRNHSSYEEYARRAEQVRKRAYRTGVQRPSQLILAGKTKV